MLKSIRIALSIAALAAFIGCSAEDCPPIPDGYYQADATSPGYTFQDGLPLAFQAWSCQPSETGCTTAYQCTNDGQTVTVTVDQVRTGVVELTIGTTPTQTLYLAGSK
jgi:hypothetical protein